MDCNYTAQGFLECKAVSINSSSKRPTYVLGDKCAFVPIEPKLQSHDDAASYQRCVRLCENKDAVFDGNWTPNSCKCCKQ